jgi:hypothetical protein|uniref:Uncharacterized protein n=1 Tax=viral metagenome TaxID=1070528 RepID=A0A6C0AHR4_9ZZZZ
MSDSPTVPPLEKKPKTAPTLHQDTLDIIRVFFGLPASETVSGFFHSYSDAQNSCRDARNDFMAGVDSNVEWAKAYAKELKARAALKTVL